MNDLTPNLENRPHKPKSEGFIPGFAHCRTSTIPLIICPLGIRHQSRKFKPPKKLKYKFSPPLYFLCLTKTSLVPLLTIKSTEDWSWCKRNIIKSFLELMMKSKSKFLKSKRESRGKINGPVTCDVINDESMAWIGTGGIKVLIKARI